MKIHYLSCHSVLEYDEVKLLSEMGHEVFANGAYLNPHEKTNLLPRPDIPEAKYFPQYEKLARQFPKTNLPETLIEPFDLLIIMHTPEFVTENWDKMRHKNVIWRSIGQSNQHVENMIRRARYDNLKIVRYSPMEEKIPGYLGADAFIRFYKDPEEFKNWNGTEKRVINFTQSLKGRSIFCHYEHIMQMMHDFPAMVYGGGNNDLGPLNGGDLPYDLMKGAMRDNRAFVYSGTWPAPYTLSFIEAFMTGIPIVAIGRSMAEDIPEIAQADRFQFYEITNFIENGVNGFIADDIGQARAYVHQLLEDHDLARRIGDAGRQKAIEIFGKETIKKQWEEFLSTIK